jgi:hypothetical protein
MDLALDFGNVKQPLTICNGMGWNSWAMLVGFYERGIRPDLIITAHTGSEKNATYEAQPRLHAWLEKVGFPAVTYVRYEPKNFKNWPPYHTLEDNCLTNGTLPSLAFGGRKNCSAKWKVTPQLQWMKDWEPARRAWSAGVKVIKCIGFDASPIDARRCNTYAKMPPDEVDKYEIQYPLIDWDWDREECGRQIRRHGLEPPPKSSCFFCPAMKTHEVRVLPKDELKRIVVMEARAKPKLQKIQGLWGNGIKGVRGGDKRPGSMTEFIRQEGLLSDDVIRELTTETPKEIVAYQEGYAQALEAGNADAYLKSQPNDYRQKKGLTDDNDSNT